MTSAKNGCHFFCFFGGVCNGMELHISVVHVHFSERFVAHLFCECAKTENFAYFYSFLFGNSKNTFIILCSERWENVSFNIKLEF